MLFNAPNKLQYFLQILFRRYPMTQSQRQYIKSVICAVLLNLELTISSICSVRAFFQRNKSSGSRMFRNEQFTTDKLAWESALILIEKTYKKLKQKEKQKQNKSMRKKSKKNKSKKKKSKPWVLIIDTTHRKRFGKLLENLIKYKKKSARGTYAYVWPLLIAPDGTRISFPPPIWYSMKFAKENSLSRKTQSQLAASFLKLLAGKLEAIGCHIKIVVLADSAFENKKMWKVCKKNDWTFITSCEKGRCLGEGPQAIPCAKEKVYDQMEKVPDRRKKLAPSKVLGICFRSVQESRQKKAGGISHWFAYYTKQLIVADVGTLKVVRSHKLKDRSQNICEAPVKILLCSDLSLCGREIISFYAFRWQVETFFRENKSHLHFDDFQAHDFRACWKFVDLLCVTFNFLEFFRLQLIEKHDYSICDCHEELEFMRTSKLKLIFQRHAFADSIDWFLQRAQTTFGLRRIKEAVRNLSIPFYDFSSLSKLSH